MRMQHSTFHHYILLGTTKKWNDALLGRYTLLSKILLLVGTVTRNLFMMTIVGSLEGDTHDESVDLQPFAPHLISDIVHQHSYHRII